MLLKKSVLVIGGSGFIGSHLVDELIINNYKVTVLDIKKSKFSNSKANYVISSTENNKKLSSNIKKNKIVYHLAGISDLNKAYKDPIGTAKKNILATVKILDLCAKYKVDKFIFSSSIYVNSSSGGFYKSSKIACESYIEEFSKLYGIKYRILRYGSVYGPRADQSNGIHLIIRDGLRKNKLVYNGSSRSIRKYIHVKDVAKISVKLLSNIYDNKYIDITGDKNLKVKKLLEIISKIMNIRNIEFSKNTYTGHYIKTPFNRKAAKSISIKHNNKIKIENGIKEILEEFYEY